MHAVQPASVDLRCVLILQGLSSTNSASLFDEVSPIAGIDDITNNQGT